MKWTLNTSNQGKLSEFKILFAERGVELASSQIDLDEIDSDPISVVVHKASQMSEGILVEDTSLDVEGAEIGINIRWLFEHLNQFINKKALCRVLLAHLLDNQVYVYEGLLEGLIVNPRGKGGFGFDPFFLPKNSDLTLAESKPRHFDARAFAVNAFFEKRPLVVMPPIKEWNGSWQVS